MRGGSVVLCWSGAYLDAGMLARVHCSTKRRFTGTFELHPRPPLGAADRLTGWPITVWAHAGLLGIGGGMIVSPLLLELGLHPLVAAATSSLMVLFSASSAALSFAFDHLLNVQYALIYGVGAPRSWVFRFSLGVLC